MNTKQAQLDAQMLTSFVSSSTTETKDNNKNKSRLNLIDNN